MNIKMQRTGEMQAAHQRTVLRHARDEASRRFRVDNKNLYMQAGKNITQKESS